MATRSLPTATTFSILSGLEWSTDEIRGGWQELSRGLGKVQKRDSQAIRRIGWKEGQMIHRADVQKAVNEFEGVLRLEPCWVPRFFMIPGRRLKLHSDDLYAFGVHRGGINERWFSSTTKASNGPETGEFEGLS